MLQFGYGLGSFLPDKVRELREAADTIEALV